MSAEANLAGLYPPEGYEVWKEDLRWQPLPVHSVPKPFDNVGHSCSWCTGVQILCLALMPQEIFS